MFLFCKGHFSLISNISVLSIVIMTQFHLFNPMRQSLKLNLYILNIHSTSISQPWSNWSRNEQNPFISLSIWIILFGYPLKIGELLKTVRNPYKHLISCTTYLMHLFIRNNLNRTLVSQNSQSLKRLIRMHQQCLYRIGSLFISLNWYVVIEN